MGLRLFACDGGEIILPDKTLVLVNRTDGGNLVVIPRREVWERSELSSVELMLWSFLVAATGRAMIDALPQLEGGCINYWEAGNWALNDRAEPVGPKTAREYRRVHLHLLGRSPAATDPSWRWGEAPGFPDFLERHTWASKFERLSPEECFGIVSQAEALLKESYGMHAAHIAPWSPCDVCGYPTVIEHGQARNLCPECRHTP